MELALAFSIVSLILALPAFILSLYLWVVMRVRSDSMELPMRPARAFSQRTAQDLTEEEALESEDEISYAADALLGENGYGS